MAAGCGSSSSDASSETTTTAPAGTIESMWRAPGEDVAVVPGTSDFMVGANRVSFLIVDKQSRLVERPTARVWISRGLKQAPFAQTTARLESIGVPGGATADADGIYVATIKAPTPGTYWFLAEPVGDARSRRSARSSSASGAQRRRSATARSPRTPRRSRARAVTSPR